MKVKNAVVSVKNLEQSAKFYTDVLQFQEIRKFSPRPGLTIAFFKGEGEATIELIEGEEGKKGLYMLGLEVKNLDTEISKLKAKGVNLTRGPFGPPEGPRIAFLNGPDGVKLELIEV